MTDAPKTPSHFYIWRNEPNGEWAVSDPETPYPADAIRAIPLPADDAPTEAKHGERIDYTAAQLQAIGKAYAVAYADAMAERAVSDAEMEEKVGRRLCAEKCAFYGDPPCWKMAEDEGLDWTGGAATAARCDEDCIALARAALSAMRGEP